LAAVFVGPGAALDLRHFPLPSLQAHEALVQVECCTVCGSDLHTLTGKRTEITPSILGHEICGTVVNVGQPALCDIDGRPLAEGDRVTWSTSVSCGDCDRCARGLPQKCRSLAKYGHESAAGDRPLSGGLSQFVHLRRGSAVVRLPATLPAEVVCPANCATATVIAACRTAGTVSGQRVLILGAGMLGLTAAAYCHSLQAKSVAVCDRDRSRLSRAGRFGANALIEWSSSSDDLRSRCVQATGHAGFDLILELSGSPEAVEAAFELSDVGGTIVLVGSVMTSRTVPFDPEQLVRRWLSVRGVHNYAPQDLRSAVDFLSASHSRFPFSELVERTFSLVDVNSAVDFAVQQRPVRIAVIPG
jgi:putative phosphonate catabolism associated alcohol dehydrogenase